MRLIDADALNGYELGLISPKAQKLFHKIINDAPTVVLEQEPCTDAISREDALMALTGEYTDSPIEILPKAIKRISKLPPVTPAEKVVRWIPVSESLPKDKTYVLTTIKVPNRIAHARSGWYEGGFFHNDNGDVWKATDMEVIAWMPLPKPYEGGTQHERP